MVTAEEICKKLDLENLTPGVGLKNEITSGYVGDLLSWVMSNACEGCVWITIQGHINIIAVASLLEIPCIILAEGSRPEPETLEKAEEEGIPIFASHKTSFQLAKELGQLGL